MCSLIGSAALLASVLALAACGGDDGSGGAEREQGSVATARREVAATRVALRAALASYRRGDRAAAEDQVSEAYVSHFEAAEGPLEQRDPGLKERLEEAIGDELRAAMRTKAPPAEVAAAVGDVVADLRKAEAAL